MEQDISKIGRRKRNEILKELKGGKPKDSMGMQFETDKNKKERTANNTRQRFSKSASSNEA